MANKKTLKGIIQTLYRVSGFRISIYNLKQEEVCAWPKELPLFCRMVQMDPVCRQQCRANDEDAFGKVRQTGEVVIYRCHRGLYEAVSPLYDRECLSGYLMMGQTLDPDRTKAQLLSCISIMEICASYISLSNHFQLPEENLSQKVKAYIEEHYRKDISLEELCRIFYCSRATLTNSFRKTYTISVHQYLTTIRLKAGCELLANENCTVGRAARESGFQDQNYFTKAFKKEYGVTPSDYRKTTMDRRCR